MGKCYTLMTEEDFRKMNIGEDYETRTVSYAPDIRGARKDFRSWSMIGSFRIVYPDGKRNEKIVLGVA